MSKEFTCESKFLRGLLRAAPKNDVRYYLTGIYADPERGTLVAVDGSMMLVATCPELRGLGIPGFIIPRALIESACKAADRHAVFRFSIESREKGPRPLRIKLPNNHEFIGEEVDGRFPEYERTIPTTLSGEHADFDFDRLAALQSAIKLATGKQYAQVIPNGSGPAFVLGTDDMFGVIMPMRFDSIDEAIAKAASIRRTALPSGKAKAA